MSDSDSDGRPCALPEPNGRPWHQVDDLTAAQVAAMQALDDAHRAGQVTVDDVRTIAAVIRAGHVHGARKRLTAAKRRVRDI